MLTNASQTVRYFTVKGMHCAGCIRKIQSFSRLFPEIGPLRVDFKRQQVSVEASSDFDPAPFIQRMNQAGFEAKEIAVQDQTAQRQKWRGHIAKLGVAGACAGNIMLLAAAGYGGEVEPGLDELFRWLSGGLFLPILFFSATPFFENAWSGLKAKKASIDTPLSLAIVAAAALSYVNLVLGAGQIYFDSLGMFVFLLLAARTLIVALQEKALSPIGVKDFLHSKKFQVSRSREDGQKLTSVVSVDDVLPGDKLLLKSGDAVPADGTLLSAGAEFDSALYTGESMPVFVKKFETVHAGMTLCSQQAVTIDVKKAMRESRLQRLIDKLNLGLQNPSTYSSLADRGANVLGIAIVIAAVAAAVTLSLMLPLQEVLERILALLVVACPCGLAIAAPLAQGLAVKLGAKKGLLVKSVQAFERASECDHFIFDKTGTLTSGHLEVRQSIPSPLAQYLSEQDISVLASMEAGSEHPVAKAIRRALGDVAVVELDWRKEILGEGVHAGYKEQSYRLVKNPHKSGEVVAWKNAAILATFEIKEEQDTKLQAFLKTISHDASKIQHFSILTGDHAQAAGECEQHFKEVSIPVNVVANATPEQKAAYVQKRAELGGNILYVGDGINDSLAMSKASVSVSMNSSADAAFAASHVHLLRAGVSDIEELVALGKRVKKVMRSLIWYSIVYNVVFALIALLGFVGPLLAVVIMPISSLSVVLFGLWGLRDREASS